MRSVRGHLINEVQLKKASSMADHVVITPEDAAADMQRCIDLNNAWNASIAEIRNERLFNRKMEREMIIAKNLELKRERVGKERLVASEAVQSEKVRCISCDVMSCVTLVFFFDGNIGTVKDVHSEGGLGPSDRICTSQSSRL